MTGDGLIHRIVQHFGEQVMVGALICATDIHARPLANGLKSFKNFNILGRIARRIWYHGVEQLYLLGSAHLWSPLVGKRLSVDIGRA